MACSVLPPAPLPPFASCTPNPLPPTPCCDNHIAVERWIVEKKARMGSLPDKQRERASRTGYIPADEDALSLGLMSFPDEFLDYIQRRGGLWDPAAPHGTPAVAAVVDAAAASPAQKPHDKEEHLQAPNGSAALVLALPGGIVSGIASLDPVASKALAGITRRQFGTEAHGQRWIDSRAMSKKRLSKRFSTLGSTELTAKPQRAQVTFIPAQALMEAAPAIQANEGRLGAAWALQERVGSTSNLLPEQDEQQVNEEKGSQPTKRRAVRHTGDQCQVPSANASVYCHA